MAIIMVLFIQVDQYSRGSKDWTEVGNKVYHLEENIVFTYF